MHRIGHSISVEVDEREVIWLQKAYLSKPSSQKPADTGASSDRFAQRTQNDPFKDLNERPAQT